jgi:hypothetical protein
MLEKTIIRARFGPIQVAKLHGFSEPVLGSRTSPYLQSIFTEQVGAVGL